MAQKMTVEALDLWYGSHQALRDVTIEMPAGEVTAFIGPSGCGKSTLLRCLNRMNDRIEGCRVEGRVTLGDEDIYADMDVYGLRRRVGMVFQRPNPFPLSIYDNVAYGPRQHGRPTRSELDAIVESTLRGVGLWDEVSDKLAHSGLSLSGGQQQRLCIARAIAVEPEILLMDEPTSAIDPVATAKIEELVELLKSRYTIVIVTHNMQQAARISDLTAFMYEGHLVEFGTTAQVFNQPREARTMDYIMGRFG